MKRDINLLPKKKASSSSSAKGVVIALSVLLLYLMVFGIAIKIPNDLISAVVQKNAALDTEMSLLQSQVKEYDDLVAELSALQNELNSKEEIQYSDRTLYAAMDIIESTCPTGVMILSMKNTSTALELSCKAESDEQVAQFLLELDRCGEFTSIQFNGTSPTTIVKYNEFGEPINIEARQFAVSTVYAVHRNDEEAVDGGGE